MGKFDNSKLKELTGKDGYITWKHDALMVVKSAGYGHLISKVTETVNNVNNNV